MVILGVADLPDASAALVVDNELVAAVEQERIDRTRHSRAFPSGAIDAVLDRAGLRARDVDRVALGTTFTPSAVLRARPELLTRATPRLREAYRAWQSALRKTGLFTLEQEAARKFFEARLKADGFERARVELVEHDRAHANAAYRTQAREHVLVLTLDTPGDGAAVSVSVARNLQVDRIFLQTALASVSTFHTRVATLLRMEPARFSALAALGSPDPRLREAFAREVRFEAPGFSSTRLVPDPDPLALLVAAHPPADVAAAAEDALGDAVASFVGYWIRRTGIADLAVAGALFDNARLCARVAATEGVRSLWVFPAAGDEGLAVGAALAVAGTPVRPTHRMDLGPTYADDACYKQLSVASLPRDRVDDVDTTLARLVASGRIVCRFAGALEIGPRPLGNRSVLFRADDPAVRERAQRAMRRDPASPVGCATLSEAAETSFLGLSRVAESARFATTTLRVTPAFRDAAPGVVHADGTALPQVVHPGDPLRAALLACRAATGLHTVGQTSFNLKGQPVVCSPGDAIRAWRESDADALLLGPYLVEREAAGSAFQNEAKATQSSPAR
jgi:carbamoyltransferase